MRGILHLLPELFFRTLDGMLLRYHESRIRDSIRKYVAGIVSEKAPISDDPVHSLSECSIVKDLGFVEANSWNKRYLRFNERNHLYDLFKSHPDQIRLLLNYEKYADKESMTIDFYRWIDDENGSEFLKSVSEIQPRIERLLN